MPSVSNLTIYLPSPMIEVHQYTGKQNLEVENHDLFVDLEHHLEPDVFENWESFKCKVKEFTEMKRHFLSDIDENLMMMTGLRVSDRWENGVLYDGRLSLRVLEEVFARVSVVDSVLSESLRIDSKVSQDGNSLVYSIDGSDCARMKIGEENKDVFRERIDGIVEELVKELEGSLHLHELSKLFDLRQRIETLRDWIIIQLMKYLRKPVFRGDCEYLK
jgi:hypothetical protein